MHYNACVLKHIQFGRVAERLKAPPWKGGTGATLSRVRIPPLPPINSLMQQPSAKTTLGWFFVA